MKNSNVGVVSCLGLAFVLGCAQSTGGSGSAQPVQSATAVSTTAALAAVPELVSGTSIGPVRVGMTRAELDGLGMPVKPGLMKEELLVGPYVASVEGDHVVSVHVELRDLPGGARVGGAVFEAATAKIETIAAKLPACGQVHVNIGANLIVCDAGRTALIAGGPPGIVALTVYGPARAAQMLAQEKGRSAAPAASCGPDAYRHQDPDFCVELPPSARGKAPTPTDNGLSFPDLAIQWAPKSNAALVAEWKTPAPAPQHHGTFEVWTTEPLPRGSYFQVFDATQHDKNDIFKIPSVRGVVVVEGDATIVRCTVTINLERDEDARKIAAAHAAELAACKSLQVTGRS